MTKSIFIMSRSEELRGAYTDALKTQCDEVRWISSSDALLKAVAGESPSIVIFDLDAIEEKGGTLFEDLRTRFAGSDLIALSSNDSAGTALGCLRAGFADFLTKPLSPEELAWGVRRVEQRREMVRRLESPRSALVRAVTQISAATSATLVRLSALEFLQTYLGARGASWLRPASASPGVLLSLPGDTQSADVLWRLPGDKPWVSRRHSFVRRGARSGLRKVFLPCQDPAQGFVFLWGVPSRVKAGLLADCGLIVRHAEMGLMNLTKFEEIRRQTFTDELTGLYNSRYLRYALESAVQKCRSTNGRFSVLFIDVDHFKLVNDRHGHLVGSEFLVAISRAIKNSVRQIDSVFRYGGDEFVVLLKDTPLTEASAIAERIRRHVEKRVFAIGETRIQTTVSIGLAVYPETASQLEELLQLADEAMYAAKKRSRNAVHLATRPARLPDPPSQGPRIEEG